MGWKSGKDREAFIAEMREAGIDQAIIDADVKAIDAEKSAPVAVPPPALKPSSQAGGGGSPMTQPETAAPSIAAAPAQSVQADLTSMKQAREEQGNSLTDQVFNVENAQLLGIPLAVYGGYKLADKALEKSGLKARIFGQPTPIDRTVDVPLEATPDNKLSRAAQQPKISAQEQAMLDRSEINRLAKEKDAAARALAAGPAPTPEIPEFLRNTPPAGADVPPQAPKMVWEPPTASLAVSAPASPPQIAAPLTEVATTTAPETTPKEVSATTESTPTEKPAKKTGRPAASTLEPTTFRADLGPGDNWLYNTAGPERRRAILAEFNEGKPVKDYKTAQEIYKKYQDKYPKDMFGPVLPIEEAKSRGIKPPDPYGKLGKVAKVGGVAGLALTAAEMANAAQQSRSGNDAPMRETLFNLLGMIPGLGTAFTAGTFSGGLNENNSAELARRRLMPPEITKR